MLLLAAAHLLVHVNAVLNGIAAVLLILAYFLIRQGKEQAHRWTMVAALVTSTLFLFSYLYYHYLVGHVRFTYPGLTVRVTYYGILLSHLLLAMTVPYFALRTAWLGMQALQFTGEERLGDQALALREKHRHLARWALPIWLYVSVTGVVIYVMLYHLWPPETL